jgi:iron complex outermembrane receptor protein
MFMRTLVAAAVTCLSVVGLSHAVDVPAAIKKSISIPAQELGSALEALSTQRDVHVVFFSEDVRNRRSEQLSGDFTVEEALQQLLSGSGLTFQYIDERTISIVPLATAPAAPKARSSPAGALRLAQSASAADSAAAASDEKSAESEGLEEILVRGRQQKLSTMKGEASILEIPQNVQVLSSALLKDMGAVLLEDGLRNVAAVMPNGFYPGYDSFRIRGFDSSASYLDGLRMTNYYGFNVELFGLERVEVVKGPASTLYGPLFSGMVNLVSKRPKPESFLDLGLTAGTQDFLEPTVDFGGSLNATGTVYGRMVALYRRDGGFVEFADPLDRYYVAPSLTWEIGPASKLTVMSIYNHDDNGLLNTALPAVGTVLPNPNGRIPLRRFVGDALDPSHYIMDWRSLGYQFTHEIGSALTFRQNARVARRSQQTDRTIVPWYLDPDLRTMHRYGHITSDRQKLYNVDTGLDARFAMGAVQHSLTLGLEYRRATFIDNSGYTDFGDPDAVPSLDMFDPVHAPFPDAPYFMYPYSAQYRSVGFYVNDQIKPTERLTLTVGGRFEHSKGGSTFASDASGDAFVPNLGVSYELVPGLVAYSNYSEAFEPQYNIRLEGDEFPDPLSGKSWEAGIKTALFGDRLNTTLAVFDLERSNIALFNPSTGYYVLTGDERSRGAEVDSQILLAPGLELVASYAYVDAEVGLSDVIPEGTPLAGVPKHSGSLWMKYTVRGGALDGLGFSLGGSAYSAQPANGVRTFDLPGYQLVNANVAYRKKNFSAQLNLNNAFDEEYYAGAATWATTSLDTNVVGGKGRSLRLFLGWSY